MARIYGSRDQGAKVGFCPFTIISRDQLGGTCVSYPRILRLCGFRGLGPKGWGTFTRGNSKDSIEPKTKILTKFFRVLYASRPAYREQSWVWCCIMGTMRNMSRTFLPSLWTFPIPYFTGACWELSLAPKFMWIYGQSYAFERIQEDSQI